jgi:periplasmic protein CpxP/Spy
MFNPGPDKGPTREGNPTMKTWIKRTLIGLAAAATLFGGLAAWAHHHHGHGWRALSEQDAAQMKTRLVDKLGSKLDLDAAQKAKLGVLADKLREQRNALVEGSAEPRAELAAMMASTTFDRARAKSLIDAKLAAVNTQSPAVVAAMADFYDSLKPEQQAKVRDYLARSGRHGRHGPHG